MQLLIIEVETRMAGLLSKGLAEEGLNTICAYDGAEGRDLAKCYELDVITLDVMLPRLSGYVAKRLRAERILPPLLMLTAKDAVPDIVRGLDLGVDDYMTEPFCFDELLTRLRQCSVALPPPGRATACGRSGRSLVIREDGQA